MFVTHGIEELAKEPGRKLCKKLESSYDILIPVSTLFRFLPPLIDKFPAAIARQVAS